MNNAPYTPVFILSCERSGSTMLRYIVDTHSKVACPGHLYLGNLCECLNRVLMGTIAQNQVELNEDAKKQFVISETRKTVDNIMRQYIDAKNKHVWCEKTPMNLEYLSLLDSHFPDAKYICLYRHCMDVVHSSINLSKYRFLPEHVPYVHRNPGNIIAAMVENWLEKTDRLLEFEEAHQEHCFRVKYESVVTQPEETLSSIFQFLNVGWENGLLERIFEVPHDQGEGDGRAALSRHIRQDSVGKGIEVPLEGIPKKFLPTIERLLNQLSYASLDNYYRRNNPVVGSEVPIDKNCSDEIADIFEVRFKDAIERNRTRYPLLQGIWKIIVRERSDRIWSIDLSNPNGSITQGGMSADFTLCLSASLLLDLVRGIRDAVEAYAQGEIEVTGVKDNELLVDLARLLFS